jgi:hypothetical protein
MGTLASIALALSVAGCAGTSNPGTSMSDSRKTDVRYSPEELKAAFAALCQRLGYRALRVEVDQSEFPFVVYGVLDGPCDYKDIRDQLKLMKDYDYSGCATLVNREKSVTAFALNMIPRDGDVDPETREREMRRMHELAKSQM